MSKRTNPTLISFASIIFIEQIFRVIQGNIDILVLGRVSHDAVAAVGVVNQIIAICIVVISIASIGTNVILAQYVGEYNFTKVKVVLFNGLFMAIVMGMALAVVTFSFADSLLELMGLSGIHLTYGTYFLKIVSVSLCLHAVNMICLVYLRNMQQKKLIISTLCLATLINITGNIAGVYFFEQVESILICVASMTVLSHLLTCIVYSYVLISNKVIPFKTTIMNKKHMKSIASIGAPSAAEHFSYLFFQLFLSWIIIQWGIDQLKAKTYMQSWAEYIFLVSITIGQATQILVGQKIGEKKYNDLRSIVNKSVRINIVLSTTLSLFLYAISDFVIDFYDIHDDIARYIKPIILLTILIEPLRAINVNMVSSLYATRDTKYPMVINVLSLWGIMVPFILVFNGHLTIISVWVMMIVDEFLRAILLSIRWRKRVSRISHTHQVV
ncbi:MATE family efflux transporter [Pontibacillus litoralis]|uniref:Multidrug transporter MatE n=1 Tax=Pontibacillus litoralis JSM 072002 TaxID=1385512 RepID=A0A0A5G642_9BACI|nr:MATE family efflux transporter [Pontibacillus litoralis]KGX86643.1 hypothetical protein N784_04350 [Pontibacillus litoralis JSM 072002]